MKNRIITLLLLLAAGLPAALRAQTSSINTFSPYSMYGIGELNTPGVAAMRAMGGVGVALRTAAYVNTLNPAAYSMTMRKSVLFDFGLEGQNFYISQKQNNASTKRTSFSTFNIRDVALQVPIAKGIGVGFSIAPYSSVGYRVSRIEESDAVWGDVGRVQYSYSGEGDITEAKVGIGWRVWKRLSIGVAAQYYWGDIDRDFNTTVIPYVGEGSYAAMYGTTTYSISRVKAQLGMQLGIIATPKRILTFGATWDMGGDLKPAIHHSLILNNVQGSIVEDMTTQGKVVLPHRFAAGLNYETPRVMMGVDYVFENWGGRNGSAELTTGGFDMTYRNTSTLRAGVQWVPNPNDVRRFYKRWAYRAGVSYGGYYQTFAGQKVNQYTVSFGIAVPTRFAGMSSINVGVEYGGRGSDKRIAVGQRNVGLLKQNYLKFTVGFALFGDDYWFIRQKYD